MGVVALELRGVLALQRPDAPGAAVAGEVQRNAMEFWRHNAAMPRCSGGYLVRRPGRMTVPRPETVSRSSAAESLKQLPTSCQPAITARWI